MMSTVLPNTESNIHIEALEEFLNNSVTPVDWLVIAHNDTEMLNSLSSALCDETAAILQVPQSLWNSEKGDVPQAIEWTLQEAHIKTLVIVGHSHAKEDNHSAKLVESTCQSETEYLDRDAKSLLKAVHQHNSQNQEAKKRFAEDFKNLVKSPAIQSRQLTKELIVHGLYYRAVDGVFLIYNSQQDQFEPLAS